MRLMATCSSTTWTDVAFGGLVFLFLLSLCVIVFWAVSR